MDKPAWRNLRRAFELPKTVLVLVYDCFPINLDLCFYARFSVQHKQNKEIHRQGIRLSHLTSLRKFVHRPQTRLRSTQTFRSCGCIGLTSSESNRTITTDHACTRPLDEPSTIPTQSYPLRNTHMSPTDPLHRILLDACPLNEPSIVPTRLLPSIKTILSPTDILHQISLGTHHLDEPSIVPTRYTLPSPLDP